MRARLGEIVGYKGGTEVGYPPVNRFVFYRRRVLALAAVVALVAIGAGGYAIGSSQAVDGSAAYRAGTAAGEQRGRDVGSREGYAITFERARRRAYDSAYREAYRAAYREEFLQADLLEPTSVRVSGP